MIPVMDGPPLLGIAVALALMLPVTGFHAADESCAEELSRLRRAVEAIRTSYPSEEGMVNMNEVHTYMARTLPGRFPPTSRSRIGSGFSVEEFVQTADGRTAFGLKAPLGFFGFVIAGDGSVAELYAKAK